VALGRHVRLLGLQQEIAQVFGPGGLRTDRYWNAGFTLLRQWRSELERTTTEAAVTVAATGEGGDQ